MRSLPNLEIYSPGDPYELEVTVENILERKGAKYLRIGKNGESQLDGQVLNSPLFARTLRNGFEIAVLSTGNIGIEVEKAINAFHPDLQNNFAHFSIPSLSTSAMESVGFEKYNKIITIEEHVLDGGFGSFVLEYLEHRQFSKKIKRLGIKRNFEYVVGDQAFLRKLAGIDSQSIHSELERLLQA
jgi:transketolase C-terminal domain/subunit